MILFINIEYKNSKIWHNSCNRPYPMTYPLRTLLILLVGMYFMSGPAAKLEKIPLSFEKGTELTRHLEEYVISFISIEKLEESIINNNGGKEIINDVVIDDICKGGVLFNCELTSEYGWRVHPKWRYRHFHPGLDLAANKGMPIFAPADGVVREARWSLGYGKTIDIDHGYAWQTKYAHLNKIYVKEGQIVKKGDVIGEIGSTGISTGPHLHFEIAYFGNTVNPTMHYASLSQLTAPDTMLAQYSK